MLNNKLIGSEVLFTLVVVSSKPICLAIRSETADFISQILIVGSQVVQTSENDALPYAMLMIIV